MSAPRLGFLGLGPLALGSLGLGPLALGATLCAAGCGAPADTWLGTDVVLLSIDTLRADALSGYGNPRDTTPVLDALAARGARFERVLAQAPNTATSHATLFTGLPPWTHRVANISSLEHGTPALHPVFTTLAEHFAAAGYHTAALTDGGPLGASWNLLQGFETTHAEYEDWQVRVDQALDLVAAADERPLFLFLHTYEVHEPYLPPERLVERFAPDYDGPLVEALADVRAEQALPDRRPNGRRMLRDAAAFTPADVAFLRALYDAELAYVDEGLARLLPPLLARDALIAITSDHGEEFGEHGEFGHKQLHAETLHVPLILRLPGDARAGTVVADTVSLVDLHPTLLRAAGLAPLDESVGVDLLAALRGDAHFAPTSNASTNEHLHPALAGVAWQRSRRTADFTWIERVEDGGRGRRAGALYAAADVAEREPAWEGQPLPADRPPPAASGLASAIDAALARADARRARLLAGADASLAPSDARTIEELRALGYLDD